MVGEGIVYITAICSIWTASELKFNNYLEKSNSDIASDCEKFQINDSLFKESISLGKYNKFLANEDGIRVSVSKKLPEKYHAATKNAVDYLNGLFDFLNEDYRFKLVDKGGDIQIKALNEEWLPTNKNVIANASAGERTSSFMSNLLTNRSVSSKIFINEDACEKRSSETLQAIMTHEIGHTLGLGDIKTSDDIASLMCYNTIWADKVPKFYSEDIKVLGALYGRKNITHEDMMNFLKDKNYVADYYSNIEKDNIR